MINTGEISPDFCLPSSDEKQICLSSLRGKWVVLYFYPKDNTSGCTREAMEFTKVLEEFRAMGAEVLGVSRDSAASHKRFAEKHGICVTLLSDVDHKVTEAYGAWTLKKIYGKEGYGVVRTTFLINPEGRVARIWRSVKVNGHAEEVIGALKSLSR
jgi:thioredoxin-dependent peroxiredoxin